MRLTFFGDIFLYKINHKEFKFCNSFYDIINNSDFSIGNLECPITHRLIKEENKAVYMSADAESLKLLESFNIVSLANNHINDYKTQGVKDTIEAIKFHNIQYFGVGQTQKQAIEPLKIYKGDF